MNDQERAAHIKALNEAFRPLQPEQRITELYRNYSVEQVMLTSSFAATSAYLLHLFSVYQPEQEVFSLIQDTILKRPCCTRTTSPRYTD